MYPRARVYRGPLAVDTEIPIVIVISADTPKIRSCKWFSYDQKHQRYLQFQC